MNSSPVPSFAQVLFIQGGIWMLVAEVVVGVLLAVQFNAHSGQPINKGIGVGVIVLICLFIAAFGWSWGPLVRALRCLDWSRVPAPIIQTGV